MKIKICGLFCPEDIDCVNRSKPDYAGFVFAPYRRKIDENTAYELRSKLIDAIVPVGVFVDGSIEQISALWKLGVIEYAQLHGSEGAEYIARLKSACPQIKLIKAIVVRTGVDIKWAEELDVEFLLLDSGAGSGRTFDWGIIKKIDKPWFLAGGINLENINRAKALNPYGLDVSSGAETGGIMDGNKIEKLVKITQNRRGAPCASANFVNTEKHINKES